MNDLVFKKEEFIDTIKALVPSYQREFILKTLDQDENYNFENDKLCVLIFNYIKVFFSVI